MTDYSQWIENLSNLFNEHGYRWPLDTTFIRQYYNAGFSPEGAFAAWSSEE